MKRYIGTMIDRKGEYSEIIIYSNRDEKANHELSYLAEVYGLELKSMHSPYDC